MKYGWIAGYSVAGVITTIGVAALDGNTAPQAMITGGVIGLFTVFIMHMINLSE